VIQDLFFPHCKSVLEFLSTQVHVLLFPGIHILFIHRIVTHLRMSRYLEPSCLINFIQVFICQILIIDILVGFCQLLYSDILYNLLFELLKHVNELFLIHLYIIFIITVFHVLDGIIAFLNIFHQVLYRFIKRTMR